MGSEVKVKVTVEDDSAPALKGVKANIHDVETASDKAGNAVSEFTRKSQDLERQMKLLDKSIAASKESLSGLHTQFAEANTEAEKIDISKAIRKMESDLADAVKSRKFKLTELLDLEPEPKVAHGFMQKFGGLLSTAGKGAAELAGNKVGMTIGAAAGVAAAPILIGTISTALSAQSGALGLGAGVMFAIKGDKELQWAGKLAAAKFMKSMQDEAKVLGGPIRESLGILGDAGDRISKRWGKAFDALSDDLVPLTRDLVQAGERISDSLAGAAEKSGPALGALGDSVRLLADGAGDFIDILSDGGPEAAENLVLLAGATADLLRYTARFLDTINELGKNQWLTGPFLPMLRKHYQDTADSSDTLGKSSKNLGGILDAVAEAAQGELDAMEDLNKELKAQIDPVFGVLKAQQDLAAAQKETAEATRKHGENSDEAKAALQKQALAALDLQSQVGKLGDSFNGKLTPAMRATLRAAGITDDAINRIEKQFNEARKAGDRYAKTYRARVVTDYVSRYSAIVTSSAEDAYERTKREISGRAHGGITGAASGGNRSGLVWAGENGPELLKLPPGTQVHSNPDSQRMVAGSGQDHPFEVVGRMEANGGDALMDAIAASIRLYVQRNGNGDVQLTFGQGR